jgi:mRNA-degrading endonuclease RelE of RelBE toxin-antitoxin system
MKRLRLTARAEDDYARLSPKLKAQTDKQLDFLVKDLRHPSLRAKKYDESRDIWQARISRDYRVYFLIEGDVYVILTIRKHPD